MVRKHADAAPIPEPTTFRDAGLRVLRALDAGLAAELWDKSSVLMKTTIDRERFIDDVRSHAESCLIAQREWRSVALTEAREGQGIPPGRYATVQFDVLATRGGTSMEMLTFRQEDDHVWRLAGYVFK